MTSPEDEICTLKAVIGELEKENSKEKMDKEGGEEKRQRIASTLTLEQAIALGLLKEGDDLRDPTCWIDAYASFGSPAQWNKNMVPCKDYISQLGIKARALTAAYRSVKENKVSEEEYLRRGEATRRQQREDEKMRVLMRERALRHQSKEKRKFHRKSAIRRVTVLF